MRSFSRGLLLVLAMSSVFGIAGSEAQDTPKVSRTPAAEDPFAAALIEGHPWVYEFALERQERSTVWRFRSKAPYSSGAGEVFLRFEVERRDFSSDEDAAKAFSDLAVRADPDTGLSYAWDVVLLDGAHLWHLKAPCMYSRVNFDRLAANLAKAALENRTPDRAMRCRCGGGCRVDGPPVPSGETGGRRRP